MRTYADYAWERAAELLAIDSPTGFTKNAALWVHRAFSELGYDARITNKGGVVVDLGGPDGDDGLMLCAHTDTLGGMVAQIKSDGRLKLTGLGGMEPNNGECENVRLYTRDGHIYDGTLYLHNPSVHVNDDYHTARRSWETTEVVLDEDVSSAADTRALGIEVGDIVVFHQTSETYTALNEPLVKRIIATEGQTVRIDYAKGEVYVDGILQEDPHCHLLDRTGRDIGRWTQSPGYGFDHSTGIFEATVPEGCYFVMGDNRGNSLDSRSYEVGLVDTHRILGKLLVHLSNSEE